MSRSRTDLLGSQSLMEPGFILAPLFETQFKQLRVDSKQFFDEKYKANKDVFVEAVQFWFQSWAEDPLNKRLVHEWATLMKDLLFDDNGSLTYKPQVRNLTTRV